MKKANNKYHLSTPIGTALIEGNENGIEKISILSEAPQPLIQDQELLEAGQQLESYFKGELQEFTFPIQPQGTDFQQRVWKALLTIPYGKTMSYLELSKQLGDPKAIRAVASANGKNPLWIIVPCHRVIGSDGSLTGYAGGLWRKKWLLEHESPAKQQSLF
ncbi:methylated-DNA--[protein]-cysteine S-methyltransferase [Mesonia sp. MT50]|uniref:Methylated-DNA--protein-cysteine methyltransferase n=1 Tax=Mesonia profundi TaxID=3070998 RepID=A0ABU1A1P7_9FLAO|nr:methylated-DNA--[protein]-cysteine S-methyltransferase [Mesonia profundi]MDQ7916631.1 methylated-DNA--[protein]-cysteine S-methyltransferase [Mesonia profundi]